MNRQKNLSINKSNGVIAMELTKKGLSVPKQNLLKLMQKNPFARIENLIIRNGDPVFNSPLRIVRTIKLGGSNVKRPEMTLEDFILKSKVVEFFNYMESMGNGTIQAIEVDKGLPSLIKVVEENPCN